MGRLDEEGPDALVRLPEPVNRFPDFVSYLVRRLKVLCPALSRRRSFCPSGPRWQGDSCVVEPGSATMRWVTWSV